MHALAALENTARRVVLALIVLCFAGATFTHYPYGWAAVFFQFRHAPSFIPACRPSPPHKHAQFFALTKAYDALQVSSD